MGWKCNRDCFNCTYEDCIIPEYFFGHAKHKPSETENAIKREQYHQRKENGICVRCGHKPVFDGRTCCYECLLKQRRRDLERREKRTGHIAGRCHWCNNERKPGYRVCEEHYRFLMEIAPKGGQAMKQIKKEKRNARILNKYFLFLG